MYYFWNHKRAILRSSLHDSLLWFNEIAILWLYDSVGHNSVLCFRLSSAHRHLPVYALGLQIWKSLKEGNVYRFSIRLYVFLLILQLQINFAKYNIITRSRIGRVRFVYTRGAALTKQHVIFHSFFSVAVVFHLVRKFLLCVVSLAIFVIRTKVTIKKSWVQKTH